MGVKADRAVRAQLESIPPNEERLLLATGRYIGEGFDDARLDTLFLALRLAQLDVRWPPKQHWPFDAGSKARRAKWRNDRTCAGSRWLSSPSVLAVALPSARTGTRTQRRRSKRQQAPPPLER